MQSGPQVAWLDYLHHVNSMYISTFYQFQCTSWYATPRVLGLLPARALTLDCTHVHDHEPSMREAGRALIHVIDIWCEGG